MFSERLVPVNRLWRGGARGGVVKFSSVLCEGSNPTSAARGARFASLRNCANSWLTLSLTEDPEGPLAILTIEKTDKKEKSRKQSKTVKSAKQKRD